MKVYGYWKFAECMEIGKFWYFFDFLHIPAAYDEDIILIILLVHLQFLSVLKDCEIS